VETTLERLRALPLFWVSLAFLSGIALASQVTLTSNLWLLAGGLLLLVGLGVRPWATRAGLPSRTYLWLVVALVCLCLGGFRYQSSIPRIDAFHIAWYNDREYDVLVTGTLIEPPDYRDTYTNLRLQVEAIDTGSGDLPVEGLLLARTFPNEPYAYGQQVRVRGRLLTPPEDEDFSYREYLARQGIHTYMPRTEITLLPGGGGRSLTRAMYSFKEYALARVYLIFPDPEASLLAGILLGVDTGLPAGLQQAFKDTGTAHIIAISGFNITIIAGFFLLLFGRAFGQTRGSIAAVLGITLYTFLVGADAAVVRAAIMGTLALLARQFGRRNEGLYALLLSAAAMAAFNPHLLWDVGFQLSFFATLGLVLYAQPMQDRAVDLITRFTSPGRARKIAAPLSEYLLFTVAAQLTTLPIMAYHFKRLSLVALVANPFILPAQPAVMVSGGIAVLLSMLWTPLGAIAAFVAWPFVAYTIRSVELFAQIPHGVIALGNFSFLLVLLFYLILFTWTFARARIAIWLSKARPELPTLPALGVLVVLVLLVVMTWRSAFTAPDGRLHLTFLDAGSADSILIQTPGGRFLLINGGPSPSLLSDGLGRRLPAFDRRLDWLVVASTRENQLSGLPRVVERIPPEQVLWAGNVEASYSSRNLYKWFTERGIPIIRADPGAQLELGDGARLQVLATNARGGVLLLEWRDFRALLPIGMNFESLEELKYGEELGKVSLLLLGDSGYAPVNPPAWLANLNPQIVIISVAANDQDGLPDQETLTSLGAYPVIRTDQNGWIAVQTDGEEIWTRVEQSSESLP
jgi:competence protein ComEC